MDNKQNYKEMIIDIIKRCENEDNLRFIWKLLKKMEQRYI